MNFLLGVREVSNNLRNNINVLRDSGSGCGRTSRGPAKATIQITGRSPMKWLRVERRKGARRSGDATRKWGRAFARPPGWARRGWGAVVPEEPARPAGGATAV